MILLDNAPRQIPCIFCNNTMELKETYCCEDCHITVYYFYRNNLFYFGTMLIYKNNPPNYLEPKIFIRFDPFGVFLVIKGFDLLIPLNSNVLSKPIKSIHNILNNYTAFM